MISIIKCDKDMIKIIYKANTESYLGPEFYKFLKKEKNF
jgi:hypothetical protein